MSSYIYIIYYIYIIHILIYACHVYTYIYVYGKTRNGLPGRLVHGVQTWSESSNPQPENRASSIQSGQSTESVHMCINAYVHIYIYTLCVSICIYVTMYLCRIYIRSDHEKTPTPRTVRSKTGLLAAGCPSQRWPVHAPGRARSFTKEFTVISDISWGFLISLGFCGTYIYCILYNLLIFLVFSCLLILLLHIL